MKRNSVLVLMSTYNGERFLKEQIDSILAQEGVDVFLLVRDDGSKDSTCQILAEYASRYENVDWLSAENVGFVKSFSVLLECALAYKIHPDYYAFADQDDIWFRNKLSMACEILASKDQTKPQMFSCNSMKIDEKRNELGLFHPGARPHYTRGNVLICSTEQGCSMTFNRKAVEMYVEHQPTVCYHDRWLYHICSFFGSVTYEHRPLFYYRIHGFNAIGRIDVPVSGGLGLTRIKNSLHFLFSVPPKLGHYEMAREFYDAFGDALPKKNRCILNKYIRYRDSFFAKLYILVHPVFRYPFDSFYDAVVMYRRLLVFNKI